MKWIRRYSQWANDRGQDRNATWNADCSVAMALDQIVDLRALDLTKEGILTVHAPDFEEGKVSMWSI